MYTSWINSDIGAMADRMAGGMKFGDVDYILGNTASITDLTSTQVIAGIAGRRMMIHTVVITNASAVNTWVNLKDNLGNLYFTVYCPSGSGVSVTWPDVSPINIPAALNLMANCETTGADVRVHASGLRSQN